MPGPGTGNKKGAQRTKGNLKPSSSSQAAQLLTSTGVGATGFIGFGGVPGTAAFVPVSQVLEEEDSGLEPSFRVTLRKLSKRDGVTKLKALQEFIVLCKDCKEDNVKATLPFWPKIYNKLALDVDHKVREATQNALTALVSKVQRSIAPHLKHIMGSWLLCQCDTYPTVATAAQQAFSTAFPPAKQADAIVFCKDEIAEFLSDNLTTQTASTLSDPKTCPPEDMEMKYNRVVTSSLLAWRKLLETLSPSTHSSVTEKLQKLLSNPKLWKFSKSDVSSIKAGLYSLISGVCQYQTDLAMEFSNKISPLALHNIDETDTQLCGALWETVLSTVTYIPDCWSHVNSQKAFLPKFRKLLQNGCYGNSAIICPNLLPLLSKMPDELGGSRQKLLEDIFTNIKEGLCIKSVQTSVQESGALVRGFMECVLYSIKSTQSEETVKFILFDQVLPILEASLVDEQTTLFKTPLYDMIGQLIVFFNQSESVQVSNSFIVKIKDTLTESVRTLSNQCQGCSLQERLSVCLCAFINPKISTSKETKPPKSVKFEEDSSNICERRKTIPVANPELCDGIHSIINEVSLTTFKLARQERSFTCLGLLSVIMTNYPHKDILRAILETDGSVESGQDITLAFITTVCIPWLEEIQSLQTKGSEEITASYVLDILLVLSSTLSNKDQIPPILNRLQTVLVNTKHFQLLIDKLLLWRGEITGVNKWLHGEEFGNRLVQLAQNLCCKSVISIETDEAEIAQQWALITSVLSSPDKEESILNTAVTEKILAVIEETLDAIEKSPVSNKLETSINFVTDVLLQFFCNLKDCLLIPSAERLLLTLFSLSMEDSLNISETCFQRLESSWQCGLKAIIQQTGAILTDHSFLFMASKTVKKHLETVTLVHSLEKTFHAVKVVIETVQDNLSECDLSDPTLQTLLADFSTLSSESQLPLQVLQYLCINEKLLTHEWNRANPISSTDLSRVVYPTLFSARLLLFSMTGEFQCVIPKPVIGTSSTELIKQDLDVSVLDWNEEDIHRLLLLTHCCSLAEIWTNALRSTDIEEVLCELWTIAERLLASVDEDKRKRLVLTALDKSDETGCVWSRCLSKLLSVFVKIDPNLKFSPPGFEERYECLSSSKVQSLQVSIPYLPMENKAHMTEIMVARVISSNLTSTTDIQGVTEYLAVTRSLVCECPEDMTDVLSGVIVQLVTWRQESSVALTSNLKSSPAVLNFNLEVIRFVTEVVQHIPEVLSSAHWDYVLCALIGWLQNVDDNEEALLRGEFDIQQLCVDSCLLLTQVVQCIKKNSGKDNSVLPDNLLTEWEEFFSEGSYSNLLPLFLKLTGSTVYKDQYGAHAVLISAVSQAVSLCPKQQILTHQLPAYLLPDQDTTLTNSMQTLLNHLCPMLLLRCRSEQVAAYWLLQKVMGDIPADDKADDIVITSDQEDPTRSPPASLMKILVTSASAMEVILHDTTIEDCVTTLPSTEEYHFIMGYLLCWKLLLEFFNHVPSEVKPQYTGYLKESGVVYTVLTDVFRLMPDKPILPASPGVNLRENMFEVETKLSPLEGGSIQEVSHLSCSVYRSLLETMPASTRQWWKDQDRKTAAYVDRYTTKYVSPVLSTREIQSVQGTGIQLDNITIKARAASREVIATYILEEVKTEMVISLPSNYPLGNINVTSEKRVGVTASQWDKWLLQLNIFLQHQNGNIVDGLKMWKRNIDKRFEGVEECTICYSVIHGTTLQLPRLQCRTCKKKFHSACLYKWFSTSHNSTCPLCRNLF